MYGMTFRPGWHEDAKWVSGLLLVLMLALAVFFFSLAQITHREPAQDMLASALELTLGPDALSEAGVQTNSPAFFTSGTATPGLEQLAALVYMQGTQNASRLVPDPQAAQRLEVALKPFGLFTQAERQRFVRLTWLFGGLSLLLLGALLMFSTRRERLFSAGAATAFSALPGVLLLTPLNQALQAAPVTAPPDGLQAEGTLTYLLELISYVRSSLPLGVLETVLWNHLAVLALGLSLMVLFAYLRLRRWLCPKRRHF